MPVMNQTLLKVEARCADISPPVPASPPGLGKFSMPLKKDVSAVDWVHGALHRAIVSLRLPPGERLARKVLAKWLGVSATPVRDALLRLEAQGLVETRAQAETRVSLLSVAELHGLQFEREAMETEVVQRLARRALPVHAAQATLWAMDAALDQSAPGVPRNVNALDFAFHASLFEAAGLGQCLYRFRDRAANCERCRSIAPAGASDVKLTCDFHNQILNRIDAGDVSGATAAMRAHLADDKAAIGHALRLRPEWFR